MTDVFSKQIAIEIEEGIKLAKVPLGKIGEHGSSVPRDCFSPIYGYRANREIGSAALKGRMRGALPCINDLHPSMTCINEVDQVSQAAIWHSAAMSSHNLL